MEKKYTVLAKFIKDMSVETKDAQTYLFVKENIKNYHLKISINSKAIKNKMIEIDTGLNFDDKQGNEFRTNFEMTYTSIIKLNDIQLRIRNSGSYYYTFSGSKYFEQYNQKSPLNMYSYKSGSVDDYLFNTSESEFLQSYNPINPIYFGGDRVSYFYITTGSFFSQYNMKEPIYFKNKIPIPIPYNKLPLKLPNVRKYLPTKEGSPPLGNAKNWAWDTKKEEVVSNEKVDHKKVFPLELNTMPGWAGSSWYFNR